MKKAARIAICGIGASVTTLALITGTASAQGPTASFNPPSLDGAGQVTLNIKCGANATRGIAFINAVNDDVLGLSDSDLTLNKVGSGAIEEELMVGAPAGAYQYAVTCQAQSGKETGKTQATFTVTQGGESPTESSSQPSTSSTAARPPSGNNGGTNSGGNKPGQTGTVPNGGVNTGGGAMAGNAVALQ